MQFGLVCLKNGVHFFQEMTNRNGWNVYKRPVLVRVTPLNEDQVQSGGSFAATLRCAFTKALVVVDQSDVIVHHSKHSEPSHPVVHLTRQPGSTYALNTSSTVVVQMLPHADDHVRRMIHRLNGLNAELNALEEARAASTVTTQGIRLNSGFPTPYELARKYTSCIEMQCEVLEELLEGELQPAALLADIQAVYAHAENVVRAKCQQLAEISHVQPGDAHVRYCLQNSFHLWSTQAAANDGACTVNTRGLQQMRRHLLPIFMACILTDPPIDIDSTCQDSQHVDRKQYLDLLPQKNVAAKITLVLPALVWCNGQTKAVLAEAKYLWEPQENMHTDPHQVHEAPSAGTGVCTDTDCVKDTDCDSQLTVSSASSADGDCVECMKNESASSHKVSWNTTEPTISEHQLQPAQHEVTAAVQDSQPHAATYEADHKLSQTYVCTQASTFAHRKRKVLGLPAHHPPSNACFGNVATCDCSPFPSCATCVCPTCSYARP